MTDLVIKQTVKLLAKQSETTSLLLGKLLERVNNLWRIQLIIDIFLVLAIILMCIR